MSVHLAHPRAYHAGMRSLPVFFCTLAVGSVLTAAEYAAPGFRPRPHGSHALINARVFPKPDTVFSNATVLIRDGLIVSVGPNLAIPNDARVWDLRGLTVYPGLIDPYLPLGGTNLPVNTRGSETDTLHLETSLRSGAGAPKVLGVVGQESDPGAPGAGHGLAVVTPEFRMAGSYVPDPKELESLRELGFTTAHLIPTHGIFRGQSAVVTLGDTGPNEALLRTDAAQVLALTPSGHEGVYPASLMGVLAVVRQALLDTRYQRDLRAWANNHPTPTARPAYNTALNALESVFAGQPVFVESGSALMVSRAAQLLAEYNLTNRVFISCGQEWRRPDLIRNLAAFIVPLAFPSAPKLPEPSAWEGVSLDQLRAWDWAPENPALLRQRGATVALTTYALAERKDFRKNLRTALDRGLTESDALAALTIIPAHFCGVADQVGSVEPGKIANLTIVEGSYFDPQAKIREVWIDGREYDLGAKPEKNTDPEEKQDKEKDEKKAKERSDLARQRIARSPVVGHGPLTNPPAVYIRHATIWTCGPDGLLTNANLLAVGGRIASVTRGTQIPEPALPTGTVILEAAGRHLTPGLLDAHSHSMILGAVNEATLPSTAMCRIQDVVNSETDNIHQQLAGGLTVANLLHGSANPIGGQNCVIKLRDGAAPENLVFTNAPAGIKFALGENVKQSNWGDRFNTRFPQTRMGVPTFYANRFEAARQYAAARAAAAVDHGNSPPVPPDLELDALAEILAGTRLIHCHSYRQDEILAFLRTMESFGIRVATLQHILEGYKVADEIARHGAGASAFADWWAYKFEVLDAIPYAGSLMRERGVLVSFNSDSSDHARRLYLEAAKAVKYGGTPETEALKFVTLNPAKQLRIDAWVGSLEVGKDADFALWSSSPLDSASVCLETWIEGRKYFDRTFETSRTQALAEERIALIDKAKKMTGESGDNASGSKAREQFFQTALEHARHLGVSLCQDCQLPR